MSMPLLVQLSISITSLASVLAPVLSCQQRATGSAAACTNLLRAEISCMCRSIFRAAWQRIVTGDAWEAFARGRSELSDRALQDALCTSLVAAAAARCYSNNEEQRAFSLKGR